jgi:lipid kinase YegS
MKAIQEERANQTVIEIRYIQNEGQGSLLTIEAIKDGFNTLVAAGGDGTLNEVLNGIIRSGKQNECLLGVIPFGTANDFASMCMIPNSAPGEALKIITEGTPVYIDVGKVINHEVKYFINLASGGFGAKVTTNTPREIKDIFGGFAYFLTGLTEIFELQAYDVIIRSPEESWEGRLLGVIVGNGQQAGGGFKSCPLALLNDKLLDVLIIPEVQTTELLQFLIELIQMGKHVEHEHLQYFQTPWLEIEAPEGLQINLDGQPDHGSHFRFELVQDQLAVYLPPGAPYQQTAHSSNDQE